MTDLPLALAWAPRKQGASPARSTTRASRSPTSPRRAATPATCTSGSDGMLAQAEAEASCHELLPVWPGFDQRTRDRRRLTDKTEKVMWPRRRRRRHGRGRQAWRRRGRGRWAVLEGRPRRALQRRRRRGRGRGRRAVPRRGQPGLQRRRRRRLHARQARRRHGRRVRLPRDRASRRLQGEPSTSLPASSSPQEFASDLPRTNQHFSFSYLSQRSSRPASTSTTILARQ